MTWLRWVGVQGFHERKHEGSSWRQLSKGGMREDNMAVGVRLAWEGAGLTGGHAPPPPPWELSQSRRRGIICTVDALGS